MCVRPGPYQHQRRQQVPWICCLRSLLSSPPERAIFHRRGEKRLLPQVATGDLGQAGVNNLTIGSAPKHRYGYGSTAKPVVPPADIDGGGFLKNGECDIVFVTPLRTGGRYRWQRHRDAKKRCGGSVKIHAPSMAVGSDILPEHQTPLSPVAAPHSA